MFVERWRFIRTFQVFKSCLPASVCVCVYVCVRRGPGPSCPPYSRSPAGASRFTDAFQHLSTFFFFSFFPFASALVLFLYLLSVLPCLCLCSCMTRASDPVSLIAVLMWASWKSSCHRGFATPKKKQKKAGSPTLSRAVVGNVCERSFPPPPPFRCSFPSHKLKRRTLYK